MSLSDISLERNSLLSLAGCIDAPCSRARDQLVCNPVEHRGSLNTPRITEYRFAASHYLNANFTARDGDAPEHDQQFRKIVKEMKIFSVWFWGMGGVKYFSHWNVTALIGK